MAQSIGDLALSFTGRNSNARIRSELNTLAQELTTGRKSEIRAPLTGDLAPAAVIERSLSNISAYETVISETKLFATGAQNSLAQVSDQLDSLAKAAFDMENTANNSLIANFAKDATGRLEHIVNTMNTTVAGRSLFAGDDTAAKPVDSVALILDDLQAVLPPNASAQDVSDAVDAYFAAGGAYSTGRYQGSPTQLGNFRVSPQDSLRFDITADSNGMRGALAAAAKAALLDRGALAGDVSEQRALIRISGLALMGASAEVVAIRSDLGIFESRLDSARTRNGTESSSLEMALAQLVNADPFDTATRLQEVQTQLETFYTLTARLSQLSLTGYLR